MHWLQRNSWHVPQYIMAMLSDASIQRSQLNFDWPLILHSNSASSTSKTFRKSGVRAVRPPSGKVKSAWQVGQECFSLLSFPYFLSTHSQQNECKQGSMRGSLKNLEQIGHVAIEDRDTVLAAIVDQLKQKILYKLMTLIQHICLFHLYIQAIFVTQPIIIITLPSTNFLIK